jgi:O-antigen ligase
LKLALQQNLLDGLKGNALVFILSVVLIFPITVVFGSLGDELLKVVAIAAIPVILLSLFNFRVIYSINILLLFGSLYFIEYSWAVLFAPVLVVSFIINYKNIELKDFRNPLIFPFLFYLILCIPSLIFTEALGASLFKMLNLVSFIIVILLSVASIERTKELEIYLTIFLVGALLNGIYLIFEGIMTQQRAFGFSGVMYVDFVGIAFIISLIIVILSSDSYKIIALVLSPIFALASLLTQTRNSWLAMFLSVIILLFYLIKESAFFNINRRIVVLILLFFSLILGAGIVTLKSVNPKVFERTEEFTQSNKEVLDEGGKVSSSLVSRFFIWHTAVNAFLDKPWTGIGLYAFPYLSQNYYTIPNFLFELYVRDKTPHVTFLAVIVETGVIGLFGFLIFVYFMLKISFSTIKLAVKRREKILALIITWCIVYITISMFMTDAWLWQRGIVSWGMFLGMVLAFRKMLLARKTIKGG